ncbi:ferredoxin--NADP reductase [Streptomyces monomycini]|uniref:ferredoxin--NADP reductase n=1 Tax=Streptomyces monomycini TaxID=371720 RepID=UPI00067AD113|nr:FAD-binding oxidoreductase [Streptomyces monomycini]
MSRAATVPLVQVSIDRIVSEGHDVKTFVLEPATEPASKRLNYLAGQFLTLRLPVPADRPVMRSYSISTCPVSDPRLAVTVKRSPGGPGSNWLFEQAAPGMTLDVLPPAGYFTLDGADGEVLLFAAGVGITPLYSLCKYALAASDRKVYLHYSGRHRDATPFATALEHLERSHPARMRLDLWMTGTHGRLDGTTVRNILATADAPTVYVCGPAGYQAMVIDALVAAGHPRGSIRTESSGPAPRRP